MPSKSKKFLISDYNLDATLSSGQSFRWQKLGNCWEGIIGDKWIRLRANHNCIIAESSSQQHNWEWLKKYLQLDFNLNNAIESFPDDKPMKNALNATPGLRLLRQDYWETLAAFILSATKQIVQIQQMVSLLSQRYGKQIASNGDLPAFTFPTIEAIAEEYKDKSSIVKINVDDAPAIATKYGIRSIPSILLFSKGEVVEQRVGAVSKEELTSLLDKTIEG